MRNALLRQMLQAGVLSPDDLSDADMAELSGAMPSPRYDIAPMAMNTMRTESGPEAGRVIPLGPGAVGSDGLTWDQLRSQLGMGQGAPAQPRQMKVVGYGNGSVTELSPESGGNVALDYSRGQIDIPGVGKGYYGKDGRNAYVSDGQGGMTKVVLGYDREGSMALNKFMQDRRAAEAQIAQTQAATEHTQEATDASRAARMVKEDPTSQAVLEKKYGKAEKGYQWSLDGKLVPQPGGEVQQQARSGLEGLSDSIRQVDELVGRRDAEGNLVPSDDPKKPNVAHRGFSDAVGAKGWGGLTMALGMKPIEGSDASDFVTRLEQIRGGSFLAAYEALKGGGAITEIEGKKATAAKNRMDTAQSEKEFLLAARDYRDALGRGLAKLQALSGPNQQGAAALPAAGGVPRVNSDSDYNALPSGASFIAPDGSRRRKP